MKKLNVAVQLERLKGSYKLLLSNKNEYFADYVLKADVYKDVSNKYKNYIRSFCLGECRNETIDFSVKHETNSDGHSSSSTDPEFVQYEEAQKAANLIRSGYKEYCVAFEKEKQKIESRIWELKSFSAHTLKKIESSSSYLNDAYKSSKKLVFKDKKIIYNLLKKKQTNANFFAGRKKSLKQISEFDLGGYRGTGGDFWI